MRLSDHAYGRLAESAAAVTMRLRGFRVVGRNVRVGGREVDLVARRGSLLVICEVKARRSARFGSAVEAVGPHKQRRLREAAEMLVAADPSVDRVRFDVIAVTGAGIRHLPEAF